MGMEIRSISARLPLLLVALSMVLAMSVLLSADPVSADKYNVPGDHPTIQEAVDNASAGDWIVIAAGTYDGSVNVTKPMTLIGSTTGVTTLTSDGEYILKLVGSSIRLHDLTLKGNRSSHGILCQDFSQGRLYDIDIDDCVDGIRLEGAFDNDIRDCYIEDCFTGIRTVLGSYDNVFDGVKCVNNDLALDLGSSRHSLPDSNNNFTSCTFVGNSLGVYVGPNAPGTVFDLCSIKSSQRNGLMIDAEDCQVQECVIKENGISGVVFTQGGEVTDCTVDDNVEIGIVFEGADGFTIQDIDLVGNGVGIGLVNSMNGELERVHASGSDYGISILDGSDDITVSDSTFNECSEAGGQVDLGCDRIGFTKCTFNINLRGVVVSQSSNTLIEECTFISNTVSGMECSDAKSTSLVGCDVQWTARGSGVTLVGCQGALVDGCTVQHNNESGISFISDDIYKLLKVVIKGSTFSHNDGDGIDLDYVSGATIKDNGIRYNDGIGIDALNLVGSIIDNNSLLENLRGIDIYVSKGNIISRNHIEHNFREGIRLRTSLPGNGNIIGNNTIVENSKAYYVDHAGIALVDIDSNVVEDNDLRQNPIGMLLESHGAGCRDNVIRHNLIKKCTVAAIDTRYSAGPNTFCFNTFLSNEVQVTNVHGDDEFDNGIYGNFWGDYRDLYPGAVRIGAFWSHPYQPVNSVAVYDMFPLAFRYETDPPIARLGMGENLTIGYLAVIDGARSYDASVIVEYSWTVDPEDGSQKTFWTTIPYLEYKPTVLGKHSITMAAMDAWGNVGTTSGQFNSIDDRPPEVVAGDDVQVEVGEQFLLTPEYLFENHFIADIHWKIDPGGLNIVAEGSTVYISIATVGIYEAFIYVEDRSGNSAEDSLILKVVDSTDPDAVAGSDVDVAMGDKVVLDGKRSSDNVGIVQWTWTFQYEGDTHTLRGERVTFTFVTPGTYTVRLTVVDEAGNKGVDTIVVRVHDTEPPRAVAGEDRYVVMGDKFYLDAKESTDNIGITRYEWSLSQYPSGTLSKIRVSYTFNVPGVRVITLYVYDADGNWDSDEVVITVLDNEAPVARIDLPTVLVLGTTISLDATASKDNEEVTDYRWTVSYGQTTKELTGELPEFTFSSPGYYDIHLTVFDAAGNKGETTRRLHVPAPASEEPETASWVVPAVVVALLSVLAVGIWLSLVRWRTE